MTSSGAEIRSVQFLRDLDAALYRFAARAAEGLDAMEHAAARTARELASRLETADEELRRCEREYEEACLCCDDDGDEEDGGGTGDYEREEAAWRVEQARERLNEVRHWDARYQEAYECFRRQTERLRELSEATSPEAQAFLRGAVDVLDAYTAIQLDAGGRTGGPNVLSAAVARTASVAADPSDPAALARLLDSIGGIAPEHWRQAGSAERFQALVNVESAMAAAHGRPASQVRAAELGAGTAGGFVPTTGVIEVDSALLLDDNPLEPLRTVLHEGRHAYQWHACTHPGFHPDEREVARWRDNFEPGHYIRPQENPRAYRRQPVEADAYTFEAVADLCVSGRKE